MRLDVALHLADQKCNNVGTVRKNQKELPEATKKKQQQHETSLFASTQTATVTLTSYQCKKQKSEVIMRTLHPDVKITLDNNLKKKQSLFYSIIKQRLTLTSLIRWQGNPLYQLPEEGGPFTCFTMIDLALINRWILF